VNTEFRAPLPWKSLTAMRVIGVSQQLLTFIPSQIACSDQSFLNICLHESDSEVVGYLGQVAEYVLGEINSLEGHSEYRLA